MEPKQKLYQRIAALSSVQRATLAQQLHQIRLDQKGVENRQTASGQSLQQPKQLVAYVVPNPNVAAPDPSRLRVYLQEKLPNYMTPAAFVPLETLPRTANGKIDVKALPDPPLAASSPDDILATPRTAAEETLTQIWADVLGLKAIDIHDNFFELGGDSILSIQIVSRAREAGLRLAPNHLFDFPTIATLAAVVTPVLSIESIQTPVTGPVPLTPIQHWFFEQNLVAPHHWNQAVILELSAEVGIGRLEKAITQLWQHHDALRLCFQVDRTGVHQLNASTANPPKIDCIDLSDLDEAEQKEAIVHQSSALHASLNLSEGGLMRVARFERGANQSDWLLISLHHLVVDTVSWGILLADLATLCSQPSDAVKLPPKTTSFKTWAEMLIAYAASESLQQEAQFWLRQLDIDAIKLPVDRENTPTSTEATAQTVTVYLNPEETQLLLQAVPAACKVQINEVLLTALAQTLLQWAEKTAGTLMVEVEGHGREAIAAGVARDRIDLSRTVGWFTSSYPVVLRLAERTQPALALKAIKEQKRQIPNRGIGYGILRYLGRDISLQTQLKQRSQAEILFNYLGQLDRSDTATDPFKRLQENTVGLLRSPENARSYKLEVNAWVSRRQLSLHWIYDPRIHQRTTVAAIAQIYLTSLKRLIADCTAAEADGFTPSDFPDADLNQDELDDFIHQLVQES